MNMTRTAKGPVITFFKRLRNIGLFLILLAVSIIGIPFKLPAYVVSVAEYLALVGALMIVVSLAKRSLESPGTRLITGIKIRSPG